MDRVAARLAAMPGLRLLGPPPALARRLPIFSFVVLHEPSRRYLHQNFVAVSDLPL